MKRGQWRVIMPFTRPNIKTEKYNSNKIFFFSPPYKLFLTSVFRANYDSSSFREFSIKCNERNRLLLIELPIHLEGLKICTFWSYYLGEKNHTVSQTVQLHEDQVILWKSFHHDLFSLLVLQLRSISLSSQRVEGTRSLSKWKRCPRSCPALKSKVAPYKFVAVEP